MLEDDLKPNCEYNIRIITQYREGGATKILREGKCECILIAKSSGEELENIHVSTIEEKGHFKHKVGTLQSSIFQNKKVA